MDAHVGSRVRLRRSLLGMSQEELGGLMGVTFQQVQKYERGANRIGASRLYELSQILDVPVSFLFDDVPDGMARLPAHRPVDGHGIALGTPPGSSDPLIDADARKETLELARAYEGVHNKETRKKILELARAIANTPGRKSRP